MTDQADRRDQLPLRLKQLIVATFRLPDAKAAALTYDQPLIGGVADLDSLDELELALCIEDEFGVAIGSRDESRAAFTSIASLAEFIRTREAVRPVGDQTQVPA